MIFQTITLDYHLFQKTNTYSRIMELWRKQLGTKNFMILFVS